MGVLTYDSLWLLNDEFNAEYGILIIFYVVNGGHFEFQETNLHVNAKMTSELRSLCTIYIKRVVMIDALFNMIC